MSSEDWPLTGRGEELRRATAALRGSGGVVLAGAAGVGKTRLAREVLRDAAGRNRASRWVGATAAARGIPLGAFAALIDAGGGPADASLLGRAVAVLRRDTEVLAVDDAHLLDDVSATLLHQLAVERAVGLVVTVRSGEPVSDAVTALWKDGLLQRLEVAPLSERDTAALLDAALGGRVDAQIQQRLFAATRGNVLWLRHLVHGQRTAGRLVSKAGVWRWSGEPEITPALADLIDTSIGRLSAPLGLVLELVAFGEPLGVDLLATLVNRTAVAQAEARRLVVVEPAGRRWEVRLAHPLYGEAVRARTSPLRARRRRGQLADALASTGARRAGDTLRRAVLALDSDLPADLALLTEAATEAASLADWGLVERLLRAARDAGGGFEPQYALGGVLGWVFRAEEAEVELARAVALAPTDEQRVRATVLRANNLYLMLARPDEAMALLDDIAGATPDRAGACLIGVRALLAVVRNRLDEGTDAAARVLDSPEASRLAVTWAGYGAVAASALSGRADQLGELVERVIAAAVSSPETATMQFNIRYFQVFGLGLAGYPRQARECTAWLRDLPGVYAAVLRDAIGGRIALDSGQIRTAARLLQGIRGFFPGHGGGWTTGFEAVVAQALGMAGEAAGAREALDRAQEFPHPGYLFVEPELGMARAWVAAAEGAVGPAAELARDAAELAGASGQWAMEVLARHTAVCFGDPHQAARLAELAERVDGPRAPAAATHAATLAATDPDALLAASARLERCELLLPAADAAAQAAMLHRARGAAAQAAFAGARAAELAEHCEGARTPALVAGTSPLPISTREREVATLAANGLSNKQIAARLHVSVRTIEGHIYRACTRLGLTDRAALAALLTDPGTTRPVPRPRSRTPHRAPDPPPPGPPAR